MRRIGVRLLAGSVVLAAGLGLGALPVEAAEAAGPPPGRAYELVSPVDDASGAPAGVATEGFPMPGLAPANGNDRVLYGAAAAIGETEVGASNPLIFGRRTPSGWKAATAVRTRDGGESPMPFNAADIAESWINETADRILFNIPVSLGPPQPVSAATGYHTVQRLFDGGTPEWLSAPVGVAPSPTSPNRLHPVASHDLETVAFESTNVLLGDLPAGSTRRVYAYHDGQLKLVSILPDGSVSTVTAALPNGTPNGSINFPALTHQNLISADGRYVFFITIVAGQAIGMRAALYVRDLEEGETLELAPPDKPAMNFVNNSPNEVFSWKPGTNATLGPATLDFKYVATAAEAPVVFFRSESNLTDDASGSDANKIYEANIETGDLTYRPAITGAPLSVSADGQRVIFLTPTGGLNEPWELRFWELQTPEAPCS